MNYKKANKLSNALMFLSLGIVFTLYLFREVTVFFIIIMVLAAAVMIAGITIKVIFYRCPYCERPFPYRASTPDFCPSCGKRLEQ